VGQKARLWWVKIQCRLAAWERKLNSIISSKVAANTAPVPATKGKKKPME